MTILVPEIVMILQKLARITVLVLFEKIPNILLIFFIIWNMKLEDILHSTSSLLARSTWRSIGIRVASVIGFSVLCMCVLCYIFSNPTAVSYMAAAPQTAMYVIPSLH